MDKLYYTVKLVEDLCLITVYYIIDNTPKIFCEIDALEDCSIENEIQTYLDNNGYENELEFVEL